MDRRSRPPGSASWIALAALGLAGCEIHDAFSVHPLATELDPVPDVPALAGKWVWAGEADEILAELRLVGVDARRERCRDLAVTLGLDGETHLLGDAVCLFELDGSLVAELRAPGYPRVYRQFLVEIVEDRMRICIGGGGLTVWNQLDALQEISTVGYSFDDLEYTVSEDQPDIDELMVVVSGTEAMRGFLAVALPELGAACRDVLDTPDGDLLWIDFHRMTADEEQARTEAQAAAAE
jgi:hypothetical protein